MHLSKTPIVTSSLKSAIPQSSKKLIDEFGITSTDFDQFWHTIRAVLRSKISTAPKNKLLKFTILAGNFDELGVYLLANAPFMLKKLEALKSTRKKIDGNVSVNVQQEGMLSILFKKPII